MALRAIVSKLADDSLEGSLYLDVLFFDDVTGFKEIRSFKFVLPANRVAIDTEVKRVAALITTGLGKIDDTKAIISVNDEIDLK